MEKLNLNKTLYHEPTEKPKEEIIFSQMPIFLDYLCIYRSISTAKYTTTLIFT